MTIPLFQVDAFTDQLYKGNPAAVCLLRKPMSDNWMVQVAAEMNLSETAFIILARTASGKQAPTTLYQLKWFTPTTEMSLCGHATLAAAKVLWHEGYCDSSQSIHFETLSGVLTARQEEDVIELKLPLDVGCGDDIASTIKRRPLLESLGLFASSGDGEQVELIRGSKDYLVVLNNEQQLKKVNPDFARLATIDARLIIVTAIADLHKPYDFIVRVFAPSCGINEDPVTGSAYCLAGPYWAEKLNRMDLKAVQLSVRGGAVEMTVIDRHILLRGKTKMVFKAELYDHE